MIALAWVLSLTLAFTMGYQWRSLVEKVKAIISLLEERQKLAQQNPDSIILDPDDPAQAVKFQHESTFRKLNPELFPNDKRKR